MKFTLNILEKNHADASQRRWPGHMFGGRVRTSTLALIVAFLAVWWVYATYRTDTPDNPRGKPQPTQTVLVPVQEPPRTVTVTPPAATTETSPPTATTTATTSPPPFPLPCIPPFCTPTPTPATPPSQQPVPGPGPSPTSSPPAR